jgi:flagellar assembly protein FliH
MFLSRVIKSGTIENQSIRDFRLEILESDVIARGTVAGDDGFVPYSGANGMINTSPGDYVKDGVSCGGESGDEVRTSEEMPQPGITEEELNVKVLESYESGFEEGQRQAERGLSNVFKSLRRAIDEVTSLREEIFRESEEDLLKLSILVARKIIQQEISEDRRILTRIVATALENAAQRDDVIVRLNPEDYRLVTTHRQHYLQGIGDGKDLSLKPDESVSLGGCVIDTVMGEIDARLESQLDEIHKRLLEDRGGISVLSQSILKDAEKYAYEES